MDRANYFDGQRVTKDDLNYTESSKILAIKKLLSTLSARYTHNVTGSIPSDFQQTVTDATNSLVVSNGVGGGINSTHLTPAQSSTTQISIQRGWAVTDNMDVIYISSSLTINQNDNTFTQRWTEVSNATMYVVAEYQEASSSIGTDSSGVSYYTRYTPSYRINVTATQPTGSNQVALARFTGNAGAITNGTFTDIRTYYRPWAAAESTIIKTPSVSAITNLEQHQAAVGHATPTSINPHGLSLADISGIPPYINGIYVMDSLSATLQSYSGSVSPATQINFTVPSHATASVGDNIYTNSLSTLSVGALSNGKYFVVASPSGSTLVPSFVSTASVVFDQTQPQLNPSLLLLGSASISAGNVSSYSDLRAMYILSPYLLRADTIETTSDPTLPLSKSATLVDNLNRIRFTAVAGGNKFSNSVATGSSSFFGSSRVNLNWGGFRPTFATIYQNGASSAFITGNTYITLDSVASNVGYIEAYANISIGPTNPPTSSVAFIYHHQGNLSGLINYFVDNFSFVLPANWYYQITSGTVDITPTTVAGIVLNSWNMYL